MTGRQRLTADETAALLKMQGGFCCVPGCDSRGPFEGEHSTPNAFKPGKPDQLMCIPCHKIKTREDKAKIAKVKRIRRRIETGRSRKRRGKQIASRPMQSTKRQSMGLHVYVHDAGEQRALSDVALELHRNAAKFGPLNSPHEGYGVLMEEVDELWSEIKANNGYSDNARAEAVQIAAVATHYILMCDAR